MLSFILRRAQLAAQRVQSCRGPQRRSTLSLTGFKDGQSPSCSGLHARQLGSERPNGIRVKTPAGLPLGATTLLQTRVAPLLVSSHHFHCSAAREKKRAQPEPPLRELDLLRYDMKDLWKSPRPALLLGFAGLVPFVAPTLFMAVTESYFTDLAFAQLTYGAAILSFLGGARWGFALPESSPAKPDWINLANSVVPSLVAWVAVLMGDSFVPAVIMVIMGLGMSLHYDLSLLPTYPSWFKALRFVLTIVAFFSLVGTLTIRGVYPDKKIFSP